MYVRNSKSPEKQRQNPVNGYNSTSFSSAKKLVNRVSRAINREIEDITKLHNAFGVHLETYINTGWMCLYDPPESLNWSL